MDTHIYKAICGIACLAAASCTTVRTTSDTAAVNAQLEAVAVADLDVQPQRKVSTVEWPWSPFAFAQPKLEERRSNLVAKIVEESGADVLVEPAETFKKKSFGKRTLTISGYPAKLTDFRTPTKLDSCAIRIAEAGKPRPGLVYSPTLPKPKQKAQGTTGRNGMLYVRAGFNSGKMVYSGDGSDLSRHPGYAVSGGLMLFFGKDCRGLYYNASFGLGMNGCSYNDDYGYSDDEYCLEQHYAELMPAGLGYMLPVSKNVKIDGHAGIFVNYAFKENHLSKEADLDAWDSGIQMGVGLWYKRYNLDLSWHRGFVDKAHAEDKFCTSNLMVSLGISF